METLNPPGSQTLGLQSPPPPPPPTGELTAPVFAVADLVWGKIKNHHPAWWPGHVTGLDYSDDKNWVVVSYFGNKLSTSRCKPSQLKPFLENFDRISRSSGKKSKSFRAALRSALGEIGTCLELQLSCNCNRNCISDGSEEEKMNCDFNVINYSAEEFLSLVKDAAVADSVVGGVDVVKLRSWVVGFQRGVNVGHKRKAVADLVDKIDLDDPVIGEEEKEVLVSRGRRKRSMAELIAETGLGSDSEEENDEKKVSENGNGNGGGVDGVKEEDEDIGSSRRRERKKSKYLSPPYCYLSEQRLAKSLSFSKSSKTLSSAIDKCSSVNDFNDGEDFFQVDGIDAREVLAELLATGVDTMHLKWNRLAKMVKGFFAEFRSCAFSSGSRFEAYQKGLVESAAVGFKFANNVTGVTLEEGCVKSEEGQKTEVKKRRKRKEKLSGEVENSVENSEESKKTEWRRGRKRKDQDQAPNVPNLVQDILGELGFQTTGDKIYGKDGTVIDVPINLGGTVNNSSGEKKPRPRKKNKMTDTSTALLLTFSSGANLPSKEQLVTACSKYGPLIEAETEVLGESSSGRLVFERRSDAEKAFNDKLAALGQLVANYRFSYPDKVVLRSPLPAETALTTEFPKPPLPYIRKNLERMISTLNRGSPFHKVAGVPEGTRTEGMDNLVGDMNGLLSKVNKMLSGSAPGTSS